MKARQIVQVTIFTIFCGCSDGDAFVTLPPTDAGADTDIKDASSDTPKDATAVDAKTDAPKDAVSEENPAPDAQLDASDEPVPPDGSVALVVGDLIKAADSGIYYFGEDGKSHLFPNEDTFYSWFTADDFNLVKTLPIAELEALAKGKDVTIRPGTKLVKITTDPKTYAVTDCGRLHWIESEAIIAALYGADWATRIVDIPDSIFGQYTISTPITAPIHPDGQLISYTGDPNRYVTMNSVKRKIASDAAFDANRWQASFIVTTTIPYGDGADVTNAEPGNFWRIVCP